MSRNLHGNTAVLVEYGRSHPCRALALRSSPKPQSGTPTRPPPPRRPAFPSPGLRGPPIRQRLFRSSPASVNAFPRSSRVKDSRDCRRQRVRGPRRRELLGSDFPRNTIRRGWAASTSRTRRGAVVRPPECTGSLVSALVSL